MEKIRCAIIGSGNIGMNLLYKIRRSHVLECSLFVGRNEKSENLREAGRMGVNVAANSTQALIDQSDLYEIVFDATTAEAHRIAAPLLKRMGKHVIDLTPSKVGKLCVPCLNWQDCLGEMNVNMVTCGGQSMVPLAYALTRACPQTTYLETVSTISSASAGTGTRENIDEYILTTRQALQEFAGGMPGGDGRKTKAMIVLNPADPPIIMRNTLYAMAEDPDLEEIGKSVGEMAEVIQSYVPGFQIMVNPVLLQEGIIAVTAQVEGAGDFLPAYAGNLDIITCAGIEMAEHYARQWLEEEGRCLF